MGIVPFRKKKTGPHTVFTFKAKSKGFSFTLLCPTKTVQSYEMLCRLFKLDPSAVVSAEQVHSDTIRLVGTRDRGKAMSDCDSLVTNSPDITLTVKTADCVPVAIFDPDNGAMAMVHAGWRGTVKNICVKTLRAMRRHFDTKAKRCIIAIGPSIGGCCYEVDDAVVRPLKKRLRGYGKALRRSGPEKWMLDLGKLNTIQLVRAGVKKGNIQALGICSSCRNDIFPSYRVEGKKAGRTFSIAVMRHDGKN
jgi:YfiH family protein